MGLTRRNPMSEMMTLRDAMDRLFAESFVRPFGSLTQSGEMTMPLDMYDEDNTLVVRTSMPGVKPEDVNIQVQGDTLTISGAFREEQERGQPPGQPQEKGAQQNWYLREHRYRRFSRTVSLPYPVESDKAEATCENGMLMLRLPKAEQARPKHSQVSSK